MKRERRSTSASAIHQLDKCDLDHVALIPILPNVHKKQIFIAVISEHVIVNFDCNPEINLNRNDQ